MRVYELVRMKYTFYAISFVCSISLRIEKKKLSHNQKAMHDNHTKDLGYRDQQAATKKINKLSWKKTEKNNNNDEKIIPNEVMKWTWWRNSKAKRE